MSSAFHVDPMSLAPGERVDMLVRMERHEAWLQARKARLIAAMAADSYQGSPVPELDREFYLEEVRAATGLSVMAAGARIELAVDLVRRLHTTLAALEAGTITLAHARHLHEALDGLGDRAAHRVETAALEYAADRRDLASFRRKVRREVLRVDTRAVDEQLAAAIAKRHVRRFDQDHGMSTLSALLGAQQAVEVMTALDLRADQYGPDDRRTRDQRRADALHELVIAGLHGCNNGSLPPSGVSVQVTVALSTLLGVDDQPGELDGYGPIPAVLARAIASDEQGTWRRLVTDEHGQLLDYGRTKYSPPANLRRHVTARDRTCRFPNCNHTAAACEIDHVTPWSTGGTTSADNLIPLCPRHHHTKHDAGWTTKRLPDGSIEWTSTTGHHYTVKPATYPIDTTTTTNDPDPPP